MLHTCTQFGTFGRLGPDLSRKLATQDTPTAVVHTPRVPTCRQSRVDIFTWVDTAVTWLDVALEMDAQGMHFVFNVTQPEARSFLHRVVDTSEFPIVCFSERQARGCRVFLMDECHSIREALWESEGRPQACTTGWTRSFEKTCRILAEEFASDDADMVNHRFVVMQPDRMHHRAALNALAKVWTTAAA